MILVKSSEFKLILECLFREIKLILFLLVLFLNRFAWKEPGRSRQDDE